MNEYNTISLWTTVRPEYSTWRYSSTILPYYSTALIISKNFHVLSSFYVNEMGSHWVLFLLYLNTVLNWPEDGSLRPKHIAKYNLIVIIASCLDVCCVLTVYNNNIIFINCNWVVTRWQWLFYTYPKYEIHNILYKKKHEFHRKVIEHKMCVLIFSTTFVWKKCLILWRTERDMIKKCILVFM
jgi:hypothetical protein